MKLKIVYGRSGSGKSKYIYEEVKKNIDSKNIFIIVPEQSNLIAEKKLFEITGKESLINTQVLTLKRCAYHVSNEVGGIKEVHLSKVGKDMLIYDLLIKNSANLQFLGKSDKNIDIVDNMFTEFKKHNVKLDDLYNVKIEDKYTKLKLDDIVSLYEKYEKRLKNRFIDENDLLNILTENIDKSNMFDNSLIYIDEFMGFTAQEYAVFEKLITKCDEITVSICTDNIEESTDKETDIFFFNKKFAKKLIDIAKKNKCDIEKIQLKEQYRFKNEELKFLEKNIYGGDGKLKKDIENVKIFLASNPYEELEYVARNIYELVKQNGYKYNEIGIITQDIGYYSEYAKTTFLKYDIPLFIDEKKTLNQNILIKFILSLMDIFAENWSFDSVFNYLKTGLLEISKDDLYELENYCRKWGIRGTRWYNEEFTFEPANEKQEKLEALRKQLVEPLINFKKNVSENKTVEEITKEIYKFLIKNNINKRLDEKIKELNNHQISDEYNTSYKVLISILDELVLIFKDEKITFDRYKEILQVGLNTSEIGEIPATLDQVILGNVERTRNNNIKAVFVIGMNDGNFPRSSKIEGYLNDNDREILASSGIELAKTSIENLYEEEFNIYRTLSMPEEKLFLLYCTSDKECRQLRPSVLVKRIKRLFDNISEERNIVYDITNEKVTFEDLINMYKSYLDGEEISDEWKDVLRYFYKKDKSSFVNAISGIYYTNKAEDITKENISRLYGDKLHTSVSKLENYRKCPFSFHLTYGLKLREKENLKIEALDTGLFMHDVIDEFFKKIDEENLNVKQVNQSKIQEVVDKIIDELLQSSKNYTFSSSAKFKLLAKRLKKVVTKSIEYIVYTLKYSDFEILGHEIEFKSEGEFKPIEITLEDGKHVQITGKIDRVDIANVNNNTYVRIIDYKSSIKKIDLNDVLEGIQIQLITYLDAIDEQKDFKPSGVLYLGLIDNVVKSNRNLSEEEIEKELRKKLKMTGLVLADVSVVKLMDTKLDSGSSDIIPVYINNEGEISEKKSSTINKEGFDELQKQVREVVKEISKEILKGKIDIKPYNKKKYNACEYCKYKSICMS